jgi:hypothetical protein
LDISGTHYILADTVHPIQLHHGFEGADDDWRSPGTIDVNGAYYFGATTNLARYFGEATSSGTTSPGGVVDAENVD